MPPRKKMIRKIVSGGAPRTQKSIRSIEKRQSGSKCRRLTSVSHDGKGEHLKVAFVTTAGRKQVFDFTQHLARRDLAAHLAEAFYGWGLDQSARTRQRNKGFIDRFFVFLDDLERDNPKAEPVKSLRQVDSGLLNRYVAWLDKPKLILKGPDKGTRRYWAVKARSTYLSGVSVLIRWLKLYHRDCLPGDCEIPCAPWPMAHLKIAPTSVLTPLQVAAIEKACLAEIDEAWQTFLVGQNLLTYPLSRVPAEHYRLAHLLHYLRDTHKGIMKGRECLPKKRREEIYAHGGREHVRRYLGATIDTLVPYVVFIVSRGFFNTEAVLGANRRDVVMDHPLFDERKTIILTKGRATKRQRRSFDCRRPHAVPNLVGQVMRMTDSYLALVAGTPLQDRLFLFAAGGGSRLAVRAFIGIDGRLTLWQGAFSRFRKRNALPYFSLSMLRKTGSDRVHEATDGDIKASQVLLGHASANTTHTSYTSDGMRRRDALKIAKLQIALVDWSRNNGKSDQDAIAADFPDLTEEQTKAIAIGAHAVASGFTCKNPYESPQKGQRKGHLCTAWLGCFACAGAIIERNSETLARLLQLRDALKAARLRINPVRFDVLYREKLRLLGEEILPRFSKQHMWVEAESISKSLPPLPDLE